MPKPLTKERREEIERIFRDAKSGKPDPDELKSAIDELFDAEAFWRKTVKDTDIYANDEACPWCGQFVACGPSTSGTHAPGCVYVLAQD